MAATFVRNAKTLLLCAAFTMRLSLPAAAVLAVVPSTTFSCPPAAFRAVLPASALDLYDMPWTHGLVAAIAWSWFTFRFSKNAVLGGCVMSHWILDFFTHRRDLPLFRGGTKVGLGLWRFRDVSFLVEVALLIAGVLVYEHATRAKTVAGTYAMRVFAGVMILIEAFNIYGPTPHSIQQVAISAEVAYLVLAAIAWRLDLLREPVERAVEPPISILAS